MKLIFLAMAAVLSIGCTREHAGPTVPPPAPTPAYQDAGGQARFLVGLDRGSKVMAATDDTDVARVKYLLNEISRASGETPVAIAAATDSASDFLRRDYGRTVSRQQLLEDLKLIYAAGTVRTGYNQAVVAHAMLRYGK